MRLFFRSCSWGLLLLASLSAQAEPVSIAGPRGAKLRAEYLAPPDSAVAAPAVVLLHSCDGMRRRGQLNPRYAHMAGLFQELGYAVLIPDSFSARGLSEQCTVAPARQKVTVARRADDAQWAIAWLRARPEVDGERVGVVG
ncbi:MAG TPA: dienelactone hydrolase family protein, partial [Chitinolyticbacter sp.]|nr:dienelactone hydrolase family protein [Chitinolyticbacter sp.]